VQDLPFISEFKEGKSVTTFLLLASRREKRTKTGDPYLDLTLQDATGSIQARVWSNAIQNIEAKVPEGAVKVQALVEKFQERMQLNVKLMRSVLESDRDAGFAEDRLFKTTAYPQEEMFARIVAFLDRVGSGPLRELVLAILDPLREKFLAHPASKSLHHNYYGGLLEHTLSVVYTSAYFAEKYGLDLDIMICGAILHDIAKIQEISPDLKRDYTREGRLVGHVVMGAQLLRERASTIQGLDQETLIHLEHIILSHQGEREWGAPVVPQTPEAMAIHFADNADAKMEMFRKTILEGDDEVDFVYFKGLARYIYTQGPSRFNGKYPYF